METESVQDWKEILRKTIIDISQLMAMLVTEDIERIKSNQGLLERFFIKVAGKRAEEAITPYISAALLLVSIGKPISRESVRSVLLSVSIEPEERLLDFAASLSIGMAAPCIPVIYFLKVLGKEISPENIINVLRSVNIDVDRTTVLHIISVYYKFSSSREGAGKASMIGNEISERLSGAALITANELLLQLKRTFEFKDIGEAMKKDLIYYISALGVLAFLGKDIDDNGERNMEGVVNMLEAIGFKPNVEMITYIKSRFEYGFAPAVYGSAIRFLEALGKPVNTESVLRVLGSAGINGKEDIAGYVITLWKEIS